MALLEKYWGNPIVSPKPSHPWESFQTFNAGAILLNGKVHLLYRAVGEDWVSRFGYASSEDGFRIDERLPTPVYERASAVGPFMYFSPSGGGYYGCEDPRLVELEGRIYMTYNAFGPQELRVGLTSISVEDFLNKRWRWSGEKLITPPEEVHKNFAIFPERIYGRIAILHSISPKISIAYFEDLEFKEGEWIRSHYHPTMVDGGWEAELKGCGPPPIKTEEGWLIFYHAIDKREPWKYKIGAMLLDLENPEKVLYRSKMPVIEPDQWYENSGYKPGVVYTCGAIVRNGRLILYYGAADNYVCAAHMWLDEFLSALKEGKEINQQKESMGPYMDSACE
ncbi:MAG: hypothetical protein LZ158_01350 [Thaumarchaeota archaeon]|jgi:predicted GH43/DUF377 family glycosyl hydrolase|nr:hypothetical protein [Candidatus Terraquivivens yellowstonensis]MCL7392713.1 hypothetical protein [Candidatus Terraquivivens yellowstonensis]MCL7395151.1 hypothetical protein [Candidatus Terraquivivens yellowstonensis]